MTHATPSPIRPPEAEHFVRYFPSGGEALQQISISLRQALPSGSHAGHLKCVEHAEAPQAEEGNRIRAQSPAGASSVSFKSDAQCFRRFGAVEDTHFAF